jgi:hypothetical protein
MLRSSRKQTAITENLQVADEHFRSSDELERAKSRQAVVIARLDFIFSMTKALTYKIFE